MNESIKEYYLELDKRILSTIKRGKHPLYDSHVGEIAHKIANQANRKSWRVVDNQLQKLRKAGKVAYEKATEGRKAGWVVVKREASAGEPN